MLRQIARRCFELLTDFTDNFTPQGNKQALNNARSAVVVPRQQKAFVDSRLASITPDCSETTESAQQIFCFFVIQPSLFLWGFLNCYNLIMSSEFRQKVYEVVKAIPRGQTMSYGEVTAFAGKPGDARAVGNVLNKNHDPNVPCHRVIKSDGSLGGYNGGAAKKEKLLREEGAIK